jgi:type III secretion protein J
MKLSVFANGAVARLLGGVALFAAILILSGCKDVLYGRLSEPQANEILAALSEARIDSAKSRVDENIWQVEVDTSHAGAALVYLRDRGLPSQRTATMGEVFKKEGLISSPVEERARYAFALQEDLATTLRRIDGVVEARVHVALPKNDPLSERQIPASASVFLKYRAPLDVEMLSPEIKKMVMTSIEGLDFRNISLFALQIDGASGAGNVSRTMLKAASYEPTGKGADNARPGTLRFNENFGWAAAVLGCVSLAGFALPRRSSRVRTRVTRNSSATSRSPVDKPRDEKASQALRHGSLSEQMAPGFLDSDGELRLAAESKLPKPDAQGKSPDKGSSVQAGTGASAIKAKASSQLASATRTNHALSPKGINNNPRPIAAQADEMLKKIAGRAMRWFSDFSRQRSDDRQP